MLPVPLGTGGGLLLPAKAQLASAALREYRELLRKTRSNRSSDESSRWVQVTGGAASAAVARHPPCRLPLPLYHYHS